MLYDSKHRSSVFSDKGFWINVERSNNRRMTGEKTCCSALLSIANMKPCYFKLYTLLCSNLVVFSALAGDKLFIYSVSIQISVLLWVAGLLLCRMSKPGGCVKPSMIRRSVSGVVSTVLASSSTELLLTSLSTRCRRPRVPIWSTCPPTRSRNLDG